MRSSSSSRVGTDESFEDSLPQHPRASAITITILILLTLTGCGSFRVVREARGGGGTVALQGAHDAARAKAERYMREQCPNGFEVVEEGDAATVGEQREWRLSYVCAGTSAPRATLVAF